MHLEISLKDCQPSCEMMTLLRVIFHISVNIRSRRNVSFGTAGAVDNDDDDNNTYLNVSFAGKVFFLFSL